MVPRVGTCGKHRRRHPFAADRVPVTLPCGEASSTLRSSRSSPASPPGRDPGPSLATAGPNMDRILQRRESLRQNLKAGRPRCPAGQLADECLLPDRVHRRFLGPARRAARRDLILSDGRFTTQLEQECPGLEACIRPAGQAMNQAIAQAGGIAGSQAAGLRGERPDRGRFRDDPAGAAHGRAWSPTAERVEALRQIKDERGDRGDPGSDRVCRAGVRDAPARAPARASPRSTSPTCWRRTATVRGDRGELSADRGRGGPFGLAPRAADDDDPDRR